MIPVILDKRNSKIRSGQVFNTLLSYLKGSINQEDLLGEFQSQKFEEIINYTANPIDASNSQEKCIAIRTNGVTDISTAAIEMNAVAARNTRCEDPAMHFVFAWPEFERPAPDLIFNAAEHAIKSLGLADHQYVLAVHVNTDNIHCHCAVNRIHPETYKSRNIEWAHKTIHLAARQSEIKNRLS
jgi:Relaxase/Mobilisation nuclease domain